MTEARSPYFSIVIATFNREKMLRTAIDSVRRQSADDVEIIVVDGGSTDGTLEALAASPDLSIIQGPDRGVYDAWNKGIAAARGEVVALLNSDDLYPIDAFAAVRSAFAEHPDADAVCGTAVLQSDGRQIAAYDLVDEKTLRSPRTALSGNCVINARFFRRAGMVGIGEFDLRYRFVSDRDWLVRWCERKLVTVAIDETVYCYNQHMGSMTFNDETKHIDAIRSELRVLARRWRHDGRIAMTRMAAIDLEGRCIGKIALGFLRQRQWTRALQSLLSDENRWSLSPLVCLARACLNRIASGGRR